MKPDLVQRPDISSKHVNWKAHMHIFPTDLSKVSDKNYILALPFWSSDLHPLSHFYTPFFLSSFLSAFSSFASSFRLSSFASLQVTAFHSWNLLATSSQFSFQFNFQYYFSRLQHPCSWLIWHTSFSVPFPCLLSYQFNHVFLWS
jgi:hypothetical protein